MTNDDLSTWHTKAEAAALLRTSTKTIERYIAAGRIEARKRQQPGAKPLTVCNPADVEQLQPAAHVMPALAAAAIAPAGPAASLPATFSDSGTLWHVFAAALAHASTAATQQQPATPKRFLTLPEASAYTGLSEKFLRARISARKLKAERDGREWKVRRNDLDKL